MFEKVKRYYAAGLYTAAMVRQFFLRGKLTEAEYRNIVEGNGNEDP